MKGLRGMLLAITLTGVLGVLSEVSPIPPDDLLKTAHAQWGLPRAAAQEQAPELPTGVTWLNTPRPLTMAELRGKVVLIDFWEYTCVNCIRTPEFRFAKETANVARAAKEFGLTYPIAVDSQMAIWNAYANQYWPAKYLIDTKGIVRGHHFGEGGYGDTEAAIQALLKEADPAVALPKILEPIRGEDQPGAVCYPMTPELYAGYLRGELGNPEGDQPGKLVTFKDPGDYQDGAVYAHGEWFRGPEALIHKRKSKAPQDYIAVRYHAIQANTVLKPESGHPVRLYVTQDGKPVDRQDRGDDLRYAADGRSYLQVDQPRMYNVIKNRKWGTHTLKLATADAGLGLYSFTFTSCTVAGD
jgi:thioredoxin family protein